MPQVTVYIRNEDLPRWKSIEKKTEFLSRALNQEENLTTPEVLKAVRKTATQLIKEQKVLFCKNGHILQEGRTKCSTKGCR